ncbi:hypothetical protein OIU85_017862 [Salix viminalis]|uniref:Reverse transcriptase domain-containing protein n=1 Tax=Salix viminalis TaxID=40686 RepID=A0A9Q0USI2_SALVM|nr:hypothetical protein OIU85_017862 [Salix viminalis]
MVSRELKVDFNRAFDSSNWEYLEEVMKCMGFGNKWIAVVHARISGSQLVILINGPLMNTNFPRSIRLYQTHTEEYIPLSTRIHRGVQIRILGVEVQLKMTTTPLIRLPASTTSYTVNRGRIEYQQRRFETMGADQSGKL